VLTYPVSRLLRRYEWIEQRYWSRSLEQIIAVEIGAMRALARVFGAGQLPDLPTYDKALGDSRELQLPAWMQKFEQVNAERRVSHETDEAKQ